MTRTELIFEVARKSNLPVYQAAAVVNATFEIIRDELSVGNEVNALGFGTFSVKARASHTGVNPRTREAIQLPATNYPYFKASKSFKAAVNQS